MDWLEQNLDAYRIIGEILNDLRSIIRERLDAVHGKAWYKSGLPAGLLESLIEVKEREKAIDWYESEYQQVMSYAVFPDLLQILDHDPNLFPQIMRLAPTPALLHARFLELEVMRSKLGRARPISDTELAFLGTFHLRFRKAIDDFRQQPPAAPSQAPAEAAPPPEKEQPAPAAADPPKAPAATPMDGSDTDPNLWQDDVEPEIDAVQRPAPRAASGSGASKRSRKAGAPPTTEKAGEAEEPEPADARETAAAPKEAVSLEDALHEGDDREVLRALYREVTTIAEGIWTKDVLPSTKVWDKVSTSTWYERNFSRLGLKPLSDYYEVISKVDKKMRAGTSKEELQDYLKQSNFAQVLLALRDVFQRGQI